MASSDAREFAVFSMAEALDEYKASRKKRRRLPDGIYYTEKEAKAWYHYDPQKAEQMWDAGVPNPGEEKEDEIHELVVKALWPTPAPQRILCDDGLYCMGAALVPAREAVEDVVELLTHYRNEALQNRSQSTGAAEPGVRTPMPAPILSEPELGFAWAKWKADFETASFEKYVQERIGDMHVAKAVLRHGVPMDYATVTEIVDRVRKLKTDARGGAAGPAKRFKPQQPTEPPPPWMRSTSPTLHRCRRADDAAPTTTASPRLPGVRRRGKRGGLRYAKRKTLM